MQRYKKYKDSGIEFMKEIPSHWDIRKFNSISYMKGRIGWQGLKQSEFTFNENDPYLITGMNFKHGHIRWDEVYHISDERYKQAPEIQLTDGDVLITKDGTIGKVLFVGNIPYPNKASLNSHLLVFRPLNNKYKPKYLYYQLQSFIFHSHIELTKTGTTFFGITQEAVGHYKTLLPTIKEQIAIANYLDRKTAEIDELIAKKERLIELYEEEKTAVINQAVTKGLDPDVKMKDSGIEWLGKIPAHWKMKKLKYLGSVKYGLGQPPKQKFDGLPLIRATNIFRGIIDENDMIFVDPDDIPYDRDPVLEENDIIVVRSGAYTADSAIIHKKYEGAITGYDMVFRAYENCNPNFIAFCLLSSYVLKNQLLLHSLRAAQPHLNREELSETIILFPEKSDEQTAIVAHIEKESARIDVKIAKTKKLIELLKEYRTALISEVVTGKVKVAEES